MHTTSNQQGDPSPARQAKSFSAVVTLILLCSPLVLAPFFVSRNMAFIKDVENRESTRLPSMTGIRDILDTDNWEVLSDWFHERVPFRGDLIAAKIHVDMEWLGQRRLGGVDRGDDGWLFLRQSYGEHWHTPGQRVQDALAALDGFLDRNADAPAAFRVLLTPDKHTIYPEHLTDDGTRDIAGSMADRKQLERWFANVDDERIIDIHAAMRSAKDGGNTDLYFRDDTHQNWHGGVVMAEAIVDSIRPGTWEGKYVILDRTKESHGDLRKLCTISATPVLEKQVLSVARPGVTPERIHFEGDIFTDFTSIDSNPLSWQSPVRVEYRSSEGQPLVPGRTLLLHDSCIGSIARPLIRPYFEDIAFVHYTDASPEYLDEAMQDYDTVVVEVVERFAPEIFVSLMGNE